jgi:hypothetical protein
MLVCGRFRMDQNKYLGPGPSLLVISSRAHTRHLLLQLALSSVHREWNSKRNNRGLPEYITLSSDHDVALYCGTT